MKAVFDIETLDIFRDQHKRLHIAFSCEEEDSLSTKDMFLYLKQYATNPDAEKWYQITSDTALSYDSKKDRLDFMEVSSKTTTFSDFLPRRLCVDWKLIDPDDRSRLELLIQFNASVAKPEEPVSVTAK